MNGNKNDVINAYLNEEVTAVSELSGGHINGSYLVKGDGKYVLQCLNEGLYEGRQDILIKNYESYRRGCIEAGEDNMVPWSWEYPEWLKDGNGDYFHRDREGRLWRMYRYIPSDDPTKREPLDHYKIGKGLGRLHYILKKCRGIKGVDTTRHLHDLSYYYKEYHKQDTSGMDRFALIDEEIEKGYVYFMDLFVPGGNIIHGDAKVSNMITRDGEVVGFVDLDTLMEGASFDDLADCARSCCLDESGEIDQHSLVKLIHGYEEGSDVPLAADAIELVGRNTVKNLFMLGVRYYTDYLAGGKYFREEYKGQNLEKARSLFETFIRASQEISRK